MSFLEAWVNNFWAVGYYLLLLLPSILAAFGIGVCFIIVLFVVCLFLNTQANNYRYNFGIGCILLCVAGIIAITDYTFIEIYIKQLP